MRESFRLFVLLATAGCAASTPAADEAKHDDAHEEASAKKTASGNLEETCGDHEKFAHYAPKDQIMQAMVEGTPVRALCGKLWVPSRDPERFPVCPVCKDMYDNVVQKD